LNREYDVVVIGAGIAGASAAALLAADAKVAIVEREGGPGYHATGRSAAYFAPAYGNATVRNLTAASAEFFYSPPPGFTDVPLIRPRQALFVARATQAESTTAMRAENSSLQPVDREFMSTRVPIINSDVIHHGLLDEAGGDLNVDAILQGFLRLFRTRGGDLYTNTTIDNVVYRQGMWQIDLPDGMLRTPVIVNAAGAWADGVAELAGLGALGIVPKRRTALLVDGPTDVEFADWPLVIDMDENFYFKPDAGQLLVSPADETPSPPCDAQPDELDVAIAIERFTEVTTLPVSRVRHRWAGLRTFAPDKTFVVGFDPRASGFFWLAGQGGYGVQSSPGMAQLARHLLLGTTVPDGFASIVESTSAVDPARLIQHA